jgi:hypothetical protein
MKASQKIIAIDVERFKAARARKESSILTDGTAFYRLDENMKEFFEKVTKNHHIIGFEFEEGSYNFGVIVKKKIPEEITKKWNQSIKEINQLNRLG